MRTHIRTMTPGDLVQVIDLWRSCDGVGLSGGDTLDELTKFLARNPATSWVAHVDQNLVGAVLAGHDGRRGFLYHLAVHTESRRRGLGSTLVTHALDALKAAGIGKCHVMVYRSNDTGHAFWKRIGWTRREDIDVTTIVCSSA